MKNLLLLFFTLAFASSAVAQSFSLTGKLIDKQEDIPLFGAYVFVTKKGESGNATAISEDDGTFIITNLPKGTYILKVTYVGYDAYEQAIEIDTKNLNLGIIDMRSGSVDLSQVVVTGKQVLATQDGDTTMYNANSFKVNSDANAEDLIRKMPGVVIQDGKVQAQGEDIKEVLVDGKPFFGNDPAAALKSLPAEIISKIQVFDQKSEQAQFTGFDDGETSKTINIITKSNKRNGQFGNVYAGYGYEDRYQAGINNNFFSGNRRISIIGMSNNINQQNFSSDDLLGVVGSSRGRRGGRGGGGSSFLVNQQNGITTTNALGVNYSDKWGKKITVSGSYFFNQANNEQVQDLNRQFLDNEEVTENYEEYSASNSSNLNHRLNGRFEYKINDKNSISFRPRLTIQQNDGTDSTIGQTVLGSTFLNDANNIFSSDLSAVNYSGNLLFRHRFDKSRRTISLNVSSGYNNRLGESNLLSQNNFYLQTNRSDTLDQFATTDNAGWNVSTNVSYTEPVGKKGMLMMNYRIRYNENNSLQETYDFAELTQDYSAFNALLSNDFDNTNITHQIGTGYNIRPSKALMMMVRITGEYTTLTNDQTYPIETEVNRSFQNVLPFVMIRYTKDKTENFRLFYRTSTRTPTSNQLQDVLDNSNPLQLSIGNPSLNQAYQHNVFLRYQKTNTDKASVFYTLLSASFANNYITNSTYLSRTENPIFEDLNLPRGSQLTQPVNLDGYLSARTFVTYGVPVSFIKSNFNMNLSASYNRIPGLINDALNYSNSLTYGAGLTLSSNISENIDFTLSSTTSLNNVNNTIQTATNSEFLSQRSQAKIVLTTPKGLVFRTDFNHQLYSGLSDGFNDDFIIWNIAVAQKILKDKRGELSLTLFDILKQNTSIRRNITDIYIEDVQTQVLQQYVMLTFRYQIRNFGEAPKKQESEWDRRRKEMGH